jgi:hypothetical protein
VKAFLLERFLDDRAPVTIRRLGGAESVHTTRPAPWRCVFSGTPEECSDRMRHLEARDRVFRLGGGRQRERQVVADSALRRDLILRYTREAYESGRSKKGSA